jgi:hypothetical protein
MKNVFKFGFLVLAISLTTVGCSGNKSDKKDQIEDSLSVKGVKKGADREPSSGCD